jgi:hypothetical protein
MAFSVAESIVPVGGILGVTLPIEHEQTGQID